LVNRRPGYFPARTPLSEDRDFSRLFSLEPSSVAHVS
jgi:hypothetical protein